MDWVKWSRTESRRELQKEEGDSKIERKKVGEVESGGQYQVKATGQIELRSERKGLEEEEKVRVSQSEAFDPLPNESRPRTKTSLSLNSPERFPNSLSAPTSLYNSQSCICTMIPFSTYQTQNSKTIKNDEITQTGCTKRIIPLTRNP